MNISLAFGMHHLRKACTTNKLSTGPCSMFNSNVISSRYLNNWMVSMLKILSGMSVLFYFWSILSNEIVSILIQSHRQMQWYIMNHMQIFSALF